MERKKIDDYATMNELIAALVVFRREWANDIREGWKTGLADALSIKYELYQIAGSIILALDDVVKHHYRDKTAMIMVDSQLRNLVKSDIFAHFDAMSEAKMCNVITSGTKHHIRVMFECLEELTA